MRKLKEKNTRKLIRMGRAGGSLGLTLPKEMISTLGWKEKERVKVKISRRRVIISDWKK